MNLRTLLVVVIRVSVLLTLLDISEWISLPDVRHIYRASGFWETASTVAISVSFGLVIPLIVWLAAPLLATAAAPRREFAETPVVSISLKEALFLGLFLIGVLVLVEQIPNLFNGCYFILTNLDQFWSGGFSFLVETLRGALSRFVIGLLLVIFSCEIAERLGDKFEKRSKSS